MVCSGSVLGFGIRARLQINLTTTGVCTRRLPSGEHHLFNKWEVPAPKEQGEEGTRLAGPHPAGANGPMSVFSWLRTGAGQGSWFFCPPVLISLFCHPQPPMAHSTEILDKGLNM